MKIAVCIKQVPDTTTRVRVGGDGVSLVEPDVSWVVSPYDEFAVEEALRLREAKGGEVVVVSAGPDRVQSALRTALAMGADAAVHVKDPLLDATDPYGTAHALAAALRTLGPLDLVLTGQQGVGEDHAQMPGLLAELLDLPQVTMAVKIALEEGRAVVEREVEGAHEVWETSLPAVVSAQKGLNEPRYASLKGIMAAKKKPVTVLEAPALGLEPALLAPRLHVVAVELPPARPGVRMVDGDPDAQVAELVRLLREEAKVI